jgi:hypothetical protein
VPWPGGNLVIIRVLKPSEKMVRWFTAEDVSQQLLLEWPLVIHVLEDPDKFCTEFRRTANQIINASEVVLRCELALHRDVCEDIVKACYFLEGDGFLSPYVNGYWTDIIAHGKDLTGRQLINPEAPDAPVLNAMCYELSNGDDYIAQEMFDRHIQKANAPFDKMETLSRGRLSDTLRVYRGCQLFLYAWVGYHPIEVIIEELVRLSCIPHVQDDISFLRAELPAYHRACRAAREVDDAPTPPVSWTFFKTNALRFPYWFKAAKEVALIMTSSACVERIFSLYRSLFSNLQERCLEDVREASIMIHFNENQRRNENEENQ